MAREADAGRIPSDESRPAGEASSRRGPFGFIGECWAELKKVEWPNQNQVIQGTVVVLVACLIAGVFLWVNDQIWMRAVQRLILGQ